MLDKRGRAIFNPDAPDNPSQTTFPMGDADGESE